MWTMDQNGCSSRSEDGWLQTEAVEGVLGDLGVVCLGGVGVLANSTDDWGAWGAEGGRLASFGAKKEDTSCDETGISNFDVGREETRSVLDCGSQLTSKRRTELGEVVETMATRAEE